MMGRVWAAKISKNLSNPSVIKTVIHPPTLRHSTPQAWGRPKPPPFPGMTGIWRMVEDPEEALAAHPSMGWGGGHPLPVTLLWACPAQAAWAPCQALPPLSTLRASCLAPVPLQGPRARALAAGAPHRAPLPARGINPSFAWAGLGPKQWGFCPARPAITFYLSVAQSPLPAGWVPGSGALTGREDER